MAAKRRFWKKTWPEFFQKLALTSDWLSWLPTLRSSSFCRLGVWSNPRKDLPRIFSLGHVTIQDGGETPILEKDLARIFVVRLSDVRLVVMVTYLKNNGIMVTVARLSGQNGKSMETFVQNFQTWRLVVPRLAAWGFGQIREKTWPEFFLVTS